MNKSRACLFIAIIIIIGFCLPDGIYADEGDIYVIPIEGDITKASYNFINKNISNIKDKNPKAIIFEIDTYGGLVNEAIKIKDLIISLDVDTISFVKNKAESAGVLITIASKYVVTSKTATIGSAETIPNTEKVLSMWKGMLRDTAQYRGRNDKLIEAMADKDMEIEGIVDRGKLLNLTSSESLEYGISDLVADDYDGIMSGLGLGESNLIVIKEGLGVRFSKFISKPHIKTMIIFLGIMGIIIEMTLPGLGIGATIGICSLSIYLGGSIMAGYGGFIAIVFMVAGLILLGIEAIVPGFGLPGISGIILLATGFVFGGELLNLAPGMIAIGVIVVIAISIFIFRRIYKSEKADKIVLKDGLTKERGYSSSEPKDRLIGLEGIAMTDLRPSGYAKIEDEKIDVVSEGEYIKKGRKLEVINVEGYRVIVRGKE